MGMVAYVNINLKQSFLGHSLPNFKGTFIYILLIYIYNIYI